MDGEDSGHQPKRKLDEEFDELEASGVVKRPKGPPPQPQEAPVRPQLLSLSDDVLLLILQHCQPRELKALAFSCSRLYGICVDHSLWRCVDVRGQALQKRALEWYTHRLHASTSCVCLRGMATVRVDTPKMSKMPTVNWIDDVINFPIVNEQLPIDVNTLQTDRKPPTPPFYSRHVLTDSDYSDDDDGSPANPRVYHNNVIDGRNQEGPSVACGSSEDDPVADSDGSRDVNESAAQSSAADNQNKQAIVEDSPSNSSFRVMNKVFDISNRNNVVIFDRNLDATSENVSVELNTADEEQRVRTHVKVSDDGRVITFSRNKPFIVPNNGSSDHGASTSKSSNVSNETVRNEFHILSNGSNVASSSKIVCDFANRNNEPSTSSAESKPGSSATNDEIITQDLSLPKVEEDRKYASSPGKENGNSSPKPFSPSYRDDWSGTYDGPSKSPTSAQSSGAQEAKSADSVITVPKCLMARIGSRCSNLMDLRLEFCHIDCSTVHLSDFPRRLRVLSLKGTTCHNIQHNRPYLFGIYDYMPHLEHLDLSWCHWLSSHSLLLLSKVGSLRSLLLRGCAGISECVAYASLATRYGFRKLQVLDIRGTALSDTEVVAFCWLKNLQELYMEPPLFSKLPPEPQLSKGEPWELQEPYKERDRFDAKYGREEDVCEAEPERKDETRNGEQLQNTAAHPCMGQRYQVIYVDVRTPRNQAVMMTVAPTRAFLGAPVFTDSGMLSPSLSHVEARNLISDSSLLRFGSSSLLIRIGNARGDADAERPAEKTPLTVLVCRGYKNITDSSLSHLAYAAPELRYLDVRLTSVTQRGIDIFRVARPDCKVLV